MRQEHGEFFRYFSVRIGDEAFQHSYIKLCRYYEQEGQCFTPIMAPEKIA